MSTAQTSELVQHSPHSVEATQKLSVDLSSYGVNTEVSQQHQAPQIPGSETPGHLISMNLEKMHEDLIGKTVRHTPSGQYLNWFKNRLLKQNSGDKIEEK